LVPFSYPCDMETNFKERLHKVNTFIFDVDGVLTDGSLLVMPDGEFLRRMNIRDGYAMQLAIRKGYRLAIISGGHSSGVPVRLKRLGVQEVHMGVTNKLQIMQEVLARFESDPSQVLVMGDDMPDLPMLRNCGVPCCPADAAHEIRNESVYVSSFNGGHGCARDVIEQVLKLQGHWE
jgi:3-deoxy-D-manno-octulosonate 8-phosphate phosphatase (KDO 8-P phosphatase)